MNTLKLKFAACIGLMLLLMQATVFANDRHRHRETPSRHQQIRPAPHHSQATPYFDSRHKEPKPSFQPYYRPGHRVQPLPFGHRRIWVNAAEYFFFDGYFYQPSRSGYVIVDAPIGAIVAALPRLHHLIYWRGQPYYVVDNTFYRRHPKGYVVVPNPGIDFRR